MADRALIQGAAAVAAGKAAKGMAFRESMATSAGNLALKMAEAVEKREQKKRDGGAMADAHLLTYNPDNNMPEMYQKLVQERVQAANEKLNEIGKDTGISGSAQKVAMTKIVTDTENEIKSYTDYVNTEIETISLMKRVSDPDVGQDLVSSFSDEKIDIVHAIGGGNYTLDKNKNYIIDGKSYSKREINEIKDSYKNAIYDTNVAKQAKLSLIDGAVKSKSIEQYNSGVEARLSLYNRNNPKDQASLRKELATIHGYTAAELQQIENEGGDYISALKEELNDIGLEFVPKPKMVAASGSEAYMNIRNTTNRYIEQQNLPQQLIGKTINTKRVVSAVAGPNNTLTIGLDAGSTTQDGERTGFQSKITLNLNKVDDLYKIDSAIASEIYSGKDLQEFKEYYTKALNIKVDDASSEENEIKVNEATLTPQEQVSNWATIVSDKKDRKTIGQALRDNIDPNIINTVRNEKNPSRQLSKMDTEIIAANGKVDDKIVTTQEFKDLYPNYPYSAYGQDDASMLAKIPRSVKRSIINKLNIKDNTEIADIYNNKISLQRYNELKEIANLTPEEKQYLVLSGATFNELEQQNFDI